MNMNLKKWVEGMVRIFNNETSLREMYVIFISFIDINQFPKDGDESLDKHFKRKHFQYISVP